MEAPATINVMILTKSFNSSESHSSQMWIEENILFSAELKHFSETQMSQCVFCTLQIAKPNVDLIVDSAVLFRNSKSKY